MVLKAISSIEQPIDVTAAASFAWLLLLLWGAHYRFGWYKCIIAVIAADWFAWYNCIIALTAIDLSLSYTTLQLFGALFIIRYSRFAGCLYCSPRERKIGSPTAWEVGPTWLCHTSPFQQFDVRAEDDFPSSACINRRRNAHYISPLRQFVPNL